MSSHAREEIFVFHRQVEGLVLEENGFCGITISITLSLLFSFCLLFVSISLSVFLSLPLSRSLVLYPPFLFFLSLSFFCNAISVIQMRHRTAVLGVGERKRRLAEVCCHGPDNWI